MKANRLLGMETLQVTVSHRELERQMKAFPMAAGMRSGLDEGLSEKP